MSKEEFYGRRLRLHFKAEWKAVKKGFDVLEHEKEYQVEDLPSLDRMLWDEPE